MHGEPSGSGCDHLLDGGAHQGWKVKSDAGKQQVNLYMPLDPFSKPQGGPFYTLEKHSRTRSRMPTTCSVIDTLGFTQIPPEAIPRGSVWHT